MGNCRARNQSSRQSSKASGTTISTGCDPSCSDAMHVPAGEGYDGRGSGAPNAVTLRLWDVGRCAATPPGGQLRMGRPLPLRCTQRVPGVGVGAIDRLGAAAPPSSVPTPSAPASSALGLLDDSSLDEVSSPSASGCRLVLNVVASSPSVPSSSLGGILSPSGDRSSSGPRGNGWQWIGRIQGRVVEACACREATGYAAPGAHS